MAFGGPRRPVDWKARDEEARAVRAELVELCAKHRLPLPWGPYRAAPHTCFKCGRRTVSYTWVGHRVRGPDRPPAPRPRTLKERTTEQSGGVTYWVNTCVNCRITQGDNYLYDESNGFGQPPFRFTWSRAIPSVPGGPTPFDEPPEAKWGDVTNVGGMMRSMGLRGASGW